MKIIVVKSSQLIRSNFHKYWFVCLALLPSLCFGDIDPVTTTSNRFASILFGALGASLCAIIIGGTFIAAKVGKVTWDRFLFIAYCVAGFLGAPSIVSFIRSIVVRS